MRKYLYTGIAAAIGLITAVAASPAAGATGGVLTVSALGGTNVSNGDTLSAGLKAGTTATFLDINGKGVTCSVAKFTAKVTNNPTAPGSATESITALTFSSCVSNISGVTKVNGITIDNLPYTGTVTDTTGTITITGTVHATISLALVIGSATCKYTGPAGGVAGTVSNTDTSLRFSNQAFARDTGSWAGCPTPEKFTATFAPVLDPSVAGSPAVYVN